VKEVALRIFRETLAAIDISPAFERKFARKGIRATVGNRDIDLSQFNRIVGISFGKAAFAMSGALTRVLAPEFSVEGILVSPTRPPAELRGWRTFVGGHPVPNAQSFAAARAILERLAGCDERTLVIFLISGGGSSLVELPLDSHASLEDVQALYSALVTCGAPIEDINAIRKHFSAIKGGRLAAAAPRSMKLTLAISDVPQGEESALASGPTLPDPTTVQDVERIVHQYGLLRKLPPRLKVAFEHHSIRETAKGNDPAFSRSHSELILSSHDLTHAAHQACEATGFACVCDHSTNGMAVEQAADYLLGFLRSRLKEEQGKPYPRPVGVIADGEVSSPVTGDGIGGRNSAFVLACVPRIANQNVVVLSAGTDGIDGNSVAAGAIADGETFARARAAGLDPADYFRRSDAYSFFAKLGDAVTTGPTGNNLRDLRILLAWPPARG
jgi:glycerate 2-kinase